MWDKIGVTLAVVLPFTGVILTIALKVINNKERKVLPGCTEKFKEIENEMKAMKKGSTDRTSMVIAIEAAMKLLTEEIAESKRSYKELSKAINETSKEVAVISANVINISKIIEKMRESGKDRMNK